MRLDRVGLCRAGRDRLDCCLFPKKAQDEAWERTADPVFCASIVPFGKATKVDGGYRIDGRWSYLSGSDHASWVVLSATADQETGQGNVVDVLVRKSEIEMLDDWHVLGLAGTASNGAVVKESLRSPNGARSRTPAS